MFAYRYLFSQVPFSSSIIVFLPFIFLWSTSFAFSRLDFLDSRQSAEFFGKLINSPFGHICFFRKFLYCHFFSFQYLFSLYDNILIAYFSIIGYKSLNKSLQKDTSSCVISATFGFSLAVKYLLPS